MVGTESSDDFRIPSSTFDPVPMRTRKIARATTIQAVRVGQLVRTHTFGTTNGDDSSSDARTMRPTLPNQP